MEYQILNVEDLSISIENELLFSKIDLNLAKGDKVLLYSKDSRATTSFFQIINNNLKSDTGKFNWGVTTNQSYLPLDNSEFFSKNISLVDWLRNYAKTEEEREEVYLRGFLGKMIFSGEEALKNCDVLSGGEKVRCMLSKIMINKSNVLMIDEPTNHLDIESREALIEALTKFPGAVILVSHDFHLLSLVSDKLWLVKNGSVRPYKEDLESYRSDILIKKPRQSSKVSKNSDDKKEFQKKFLVYKSEVKKCEDRIEKLQTMKNKVAGILSNQNLYSDEKLEELENWNKKFFEIEEAIKRAESLWMQAQQKLENIKSLAN